MSDPKVATAQEWASAVEPRPLTLPSGHTVMVRPRSPLAIASKGRDHFDLVDLAIKFHLKPAEITEEEKKKLADVDKGFDLASFIVETVIDHVISPKVVRGSAGEGEISFGLINNNDLVFLYFDATGQIPNIGGLTGTVEQFREERRIPRQRTGSKSVRSKTKRANR